MVLVTAGMSLAGIGVYFVYFRPVLLPEDLRYLNTTLAQIEANVPSLLPWLKRVFLVMGGYIFASGLLTCHLAVTCFRVRARGAALTVGLAGLTSIGLMVAVNFMLGSDFRWLLLLFASLWAVSLIFYVFERPETNSERLLPPGAS